MDLAYGIPALAALLWAFAYVRRVARRERQRRPARTKQPQSPGLRSLSQRSEMRAGEDAISVMDDVQRTHSSRLSTRPPATPPRADADRRSPRTRR